MTLNEGLVAIPIVGLVGGWVWNAAALAAQIRSIKEAVENLHQEFKGHIVEENDTFDKIHSRLNDNREGLARIEGRLQRNGFHER